MTGIQRQSQRGTKRTRQEARFVGLSCSCLGGLHKHVTSGKGYMISILSHAVMSGVKPYLSCAWPISSVKIQRATSFNLTRRDSTHEARVRSLLEDTRVVTVNVRILGWGTSGRKVVALMKRFVRDGDYIVRMPTV